MLRHLSAADGPIDTQRLSLRAPVMGDCTEIAALADNLAVAKWLARLPHPYHEADARVFVEEIARDEPVWAIRIAASGTLIGVIGLHVDEDESAPELGYWLGEPFWGRGYGSEAAAGVLRHAFGRHGLGRIIAGYHLENDRSARVLEKLGFVETGRRPVRGLPVAGDVTRVDMVLDAATWAERDGRA